jgi:hypothetical protein
MPPTHAPLRCSSYPPPRRMSSSSYDAHARRQRPASSAVLTKKTKPITMCIYACAQSPNACAEARWMGRTYKERNSQVRLNTTTRSEACVGFIPAYSRRMCDVCSSYEHGGRFVPVPTYKERNSQVRLNTTRHPTEEGVHRVQSPNVRMPRALAPPSTPRMTRARPTRRDPAVVDVRPIA